MKIHKPDFMDEEYRGISIRVIELNNNLIKDQTHEFPVTLFINTNNENFAMTITKWSIYKEVEEKNIVFQVKSAIDAYLKNHTTGFCYFVKYNKNEAYGMVVSTYEFNEIACYFFEPLEMD